jgi:hypothetical protein
MTLFLHPRGVSAAKWQVTRIEAFGFRAARDAIVVAKLHSGCDQIADVDLTSLQFKQANHWPKVSTLPKSELCSFVLNRSSTLCRNGRRLCYSLYLSSYSLY